MAGHIKTWIEIVSDGKFGSTHAYVVISAGSDQEFRYEIPGVVEAQWACSNDGARVTLVLQDVKMSTRVEIDSDKVKMEDLMTEIVGSHLAHDGEDEMKYGHGWWINSDGTTSHAPHCSVCLAAGDDFAVSCDCGAMPGGKQ
jgi:hypothetical protein